MKRAFLLMLIVFIFGCNSDLKEIKSQKISVNYISFVKSKPNLAMTKTMLDAKTREVFSRYVDAVDFKIEEGKVILLSDTMLSLDNYSKKNSKLEELTINGENYFSETGVLVVEIPSYKDIKNATIVEVENAGLDISIIYSKLLSDAVRKSSLNKEGSVGKIIPLGKFSYKLSNKGVSIKEKFMIFQL